MFIWFQLGVQSEMMVFFSAKVICYIFIVIWQVWSPHWGFFHGLPTCILRIQPSVLGLVKFFSNVKSLFKFLL